MNCVDAVSLRDFNNPGDVQVRSNRLALFANFIGFVRFEAMQRVTILMRVNCDGADSQFRGTSENSRGNLAAVSNKQFLDWHSVFRT